MIKVTIGESKTQEKPFPKLMIGRKTGSIVYVFGKSCENGKYHVAYVCGFPEDKLFTQSYEFQLFNEANPHFDFNGSITIENKYNERV